MGKILAVWSDSKKSGRSVVTYMLANQIAGSRKLKVLVCCLNQKYSSLNRLFGVDSADTGLADLLNYEFCENLKEETLSSIIPRCGEVYFLGSYKMTNSYAVRNTGKYEDLFEKLKGLYDLIIVDTVSGKENALTGLVLDKADIILKLYCQDIESINRLKPTEEWSTASPQKTVHLISKYRNIYPRVTDLKRRFGIKKIFIHEYCETLQEMKNRDSLHLYLQRETACNKSVEKIAGYLLEELGIAADNKLSGAKVFERFFRSFGTGGGKSFYTEQKWSLK
jgi:MinD-like ATPase involved in chromosome partitioning or flagellar assembly